MISFRMDWLDLLEVQGTLRVFSNTTVQKYSDVITGNNCSTEEIENIFSYLFIDHPFTTKRHVLNGSGGSRGGIIAFNIFLKKYIVMAKLLKHNKKIVKKTQDYLRNCLRYTSFVGKIKRIDFFFFFS